MKYDHKKMRPPNRLLIRLTQHNDNDRTGHNPNETILTPDTVNKEGFGVTVNGQLAATPPARVVAYTGYQKYTFTFRAPARGSIRVWYYAPKVQFIPNFGAQQQPASHAIIDVVSLVAHKMVYKQSK